MERFENIRIDDSVKIKLHKNQAYEGIVQFISRDSKMIKLSNVYDICKDKHLKGSQNYYRPEVVSIEVRNTIADPIDDSDDTSVSSLSTATSMHSESVPCEYDEKVVPLLKERLANAIYIQQCDRIYHEALALLRSREWIAVSLEGSVFGRLRPPSLLAMATEDQIFIFDLVAFGGIFPEIKSLLENKYPRKIVFDVRYMADSLLSLFGCKLTGFLDLLVIHTQISKRSAPITLQECVCTYLAPIKFPESQHPHELRKRPIEPAQLHLAACSVSFLHRLHGIMIHDTMLEKLFRASEHFAESFAVIENVVDAFHDIRNNSDKGFDDIDCDLISSLSSMEFGAEK